MLDARPVSGFYRTLRWWIDAILIVILIGIPWVEIGGEPLVHLDIPARQFHVFGLVIFPQELFFLWLIVVGLALMLFFFTALAGRLWCGWACPQTVFTDVFAWIARRVQGWGHGGPPHHIAVWRKVVTHTIWIGLCIVIGFHLVAYFRSPWSMLHELGEGSLSRTTLGFLGFASALSYLDFALIRQSFCKYLCPYARFQSVLFDRDTLVVGYDARRGEPRGKLGRVSGDCVDCGLCVAVCPTQIDIRNGLQLECIACTQCIDACDGVMQKVGRPVGLIAYRSLASLEGARKPRLLRSRVVIYGALLAAAGIAFLVTLERRVALDLQVAHNRAALYQTMGDGRIGNAYTLHIQNRNRTPGSFRISLDAPPAFELVAGVNPVDLPATSTREARVFVVAEPKPGAIHPEQIAFRLEEVSEPSLQVKRTATFVFPAGGEAGRKNGD